MLPNPIFLASQYFKIYKRLLGICFEQFHDHHVIKNGQKMNLSLSSQYSPMAYFGIKINLFNLGRSDIIWDFGDLEALVFCLDNFFVIFPLLDVYFCIP